jgi:hypothetical protein
MNVHTYHVAHACRGPGAVHAVEAYFDGLLSFMKEETLQVGNTYGNGLVSVRPGSAQYAKTAGRIPVAVIEFSGIPVYKKDGKPYVVSGTSSPVAHWATLRVPWRHVLCSDCH